MNQTSNYSLNLPEGRDVVDIEVLNENFTTLDSTVKALDERMTSENSDLDESINNVNTQLKPVIGAYTGDGNKSRTITLGFQPSLVLMCGETGFSQAFSGMASPSFSIHLGTGDAPQLVVVSSGFEVYCNGSPMTNANNIRYLYVAWR